MWYLIATFSLRFLVRSATKFLASLWRIATKFQRALSYQVATLSVSYIGRTTAVQCVHISASEEVLRKSIFRQGLLNI